MFSFGNASYILGYNGTSSFWYASTLGTWTIAAVPAALTWTSMAYLESAKVFVAVANNTDQAVRSTNGTSWTALTLPTSGAWISVVAGIDRFVAILKSHPNYGGAWSNADGSSWTLFS
jgi:hypothetical protein